MIRIRTNIAGLSKLSYFLDLCSLEEYTEGVINEFEVGEISKDVTLLISHTFSTLGKQKIVDPVLRRKVSLLLRIYTDLSFRQVWEKEQGITGSRVKAGSMDLMLNLVPQDPNLKVGVFGEYVELFRII